MALTGQTTFEGERIRNELAERGCAELEHQIRQEEIESAVDTYAEFTLAHPDPDPETMSAMLPETSDNLHKQLDDLDRSQDTQSTWHKYRTNVEGVGKPDGYTNRTFQAGALATTRDIQLDDDPKEFFHYSKRWLAKTQLNHRMYEWGALPPEALALDSAFRPIHQKATELIMKVAATMEEFHPEIRNYFSRKDLATSPVRLLFYHHDQGDSLGSGHYDKGSLTLQLAESHKGLRIARDGESPLELVERGHETAAFFPGRRIKEDFDERTPYQPGWHDIVRTNELNQGRSLSPEAAKVCSRWALIFFANGNGFVDPDKSLTHQR